MVLLLGGTGKVQKNILRESYSDLPPMRGQRWQQVAPFCALPYLGHIAARNAPQVLPRKASMALILP
jgi:hypothetical protein